LIFDDLLRERLSKKMLWGLTLTENSCIAHHKNEYG